MRLDAAPLRPEDAPAFICKKIIINAFNTVFENIFTI